MKRIFVIFLILFLILILGGFFYLREVFISPKEVRPKVSQKTKMSPKESSLMKREIESFFQKLGSKMENFIERVNVQRIKQRSQNVKGVYMTEFIANSQSSVATKIREDIKKLLFETELNALVIDVKEVYGPNLSPSLKKLVEELKEKDIWVIARIVVFRDSSLTKEKPHFYLKTKKGDFWRDNQGALWLDPQSPEAQQYLIDFSKKVIDFGFDELQFDYIRFPSDGDLEDIVYPAYTAEKEKSEVIGKFLSELTKELKSSNPKIILSADLFGLLATQYQSPEIGQKLEDIAKYFDYISFMLYPSHFYEGFQVPKDLKRDLPALFFPYESDDISQVVSNHPYQVVYRSILSAKDYLSERGLETQIRPWLQDFNLKTDTERKIYYDAKKVKLQIKAAEDAGASGWLLWSPANIYTKEALKK